jgi:hypothetical protein
MSSARKLQAPARRQLIEIDVGGAATDATQAETAVAGRAL